MGLVILPCILIEWLCYSGHSPKLGPGRSMRMLLQRFTCTCTYIAYLFMTFRCLHWYGRWVAMPDLQAYTLS